MGNEVFFLVVSFGIFVLGHLIQLALLRLRFAFGFLCWYFSAWVQHSFGGHIDGELVTWVVWGEKRDEE